MSESLLVRRLKWCWLAIAALLSCGSATALNPDLTIKELHHTAWGPSVADGIPPGRPAQFAETPDGTLWVATTSDLARFAGPAHWGDRLQECPLTLQ